MSEERLHFSTGAVPPSPMDLAEHYLRYAAARGLAPGRRVLDIACGEGYGSWLLKEWGATEVIGVDVSEEALAVAQTRFARQGVRYLQSDASQLLELLANERFDLIVCYETIEHVPEPSGLLAAIKNLAGPETIILVSCPNDHVASEAGYENPFHLRKYTFTEFKALAEAELGPAHAWLLGVNTQGYALIELGAPSTRPALVDPVASLEAEQLTAGFVLPSRPHIPVSEESVLFYLGVWGDAGVAPMAALSLQSYSAFAEPWRALEWFKPQLADARSRLSSSESQLCELKTQYDQERQDAAEVRSRLHSSDAQLADLQVQCDAERQKSAALQREVARLRRRMLALSEIVATLGSDARQHAQQLNEAQDRVDEAVRQRDQKQAELQCIFNSRGHRLLDALYYRRFRHPLTHPIFSAVRSLGGWILRRAG